jgi:hypothetical protein
MLVILSQEFEINSIFTHNYFILIMSVFHVYVKTNFLHLRPSMSNRHCPIQTPNTNALPKEEEHSNSHCFSCRSTGDSPSTSYIQYPATKTTPSHKEIPGLDFSKAESASEFVDSNLLALWIQTL